MKNEHRGKYKMQNDVQRLFNATIVSILLEACIFTWILLLINKLIDKRFQLWRWCHAEGGLQNGIVKIDSRHVRNCTLTAETPLQQFLQHRRLPRLTDEATVVASLNTVGRLIHFSMLHHIGTKHHSFYFYEMPDMFSVIICAASKLQTQIC